MQTLKLQNAASTHISDEAPPAQNTAVITRWGRFKIALSRLLSDPLQRRVMLVSLTVGLILLALIARSAIENERALTRSLEIDLGSHLHAVSTSLREALNLADYTARQARLRWTQNKQLLPQEQLLLDLPNFKSLITQVAIIDKNGILVASSLDSNVRKVNLSDRKHFSVHQQAQLDQPYLSEPLIGRISKQLTAQYTRPIFNSEGEFDGVVVISLNFDEVRRLLFLQNGTSNHDVILLALERSTNTDESPRPTRALMQLSPQSITNEKYPYLLTKEWEQNHLWKQQNLAEFGLLLRVSLPYGTIHQQSLKYSATAALVALLLLFGLFYHARQMSRLIHVRSRILRKLEESQIKANSANAMKSKFVSSISHELRTPLNGILGFSELIGMSDDLAEAQRYGAVVHKSATHLHQLVNTLLDLAKIEAGQMEVVKIRSDVRELCNSVLSIHRYGVEQKGLMLNVKFQADIPPTILTDHIKLMQILNNLLSNAVKFTDNGAIFLSVEMDQGSWVFSVADTGIGMNAEQLSNVFNRFNNVKLDDSQSADRPGAGLGMALCKDFAELLDGSLHVYSELRVGTVVKLILPYLDDDSTKI